MDISKAIFNEKIDAGVPFYHVVKKGQIIRKVPEDHLLEALREELLEMTGE